jgi:hypothetical protein
MNILYKGTAEIWLRREYLANKAFPANDAFYLIGSTVLQCMQYD